jgi:hypothetical protein
VHPISAGPRACHQQVWCGCPAAVSDQLPRRAGRVAALRGGGACRLLRLSMCIVNSSHPSGSGDDTLSSTAFSGQQHVFAMRRRGCLPSSRMCSCPGTMPTASWSKTCSGGSRPLAKHSSPLRCACGALLCLRLLGLPRGFGDDCIGRQNCMARVLGDDDIKK